MEDSKRPLPNYMQLVQTDIRADMREVLVDWLVEVTEEYRLVSDTLYLAMAYLDRFLSSHSVSRNKLQLLGVTCMLIASYIHLELRRFFILDSLIIWLFSVLEMMIFSWFHGFVITQKV